MKRRTKAIIAGGTLVIATAAGAGIAIANSADDDSDDAGETDVPIAGTDLDKASAAALEHLGEGRVTETEVGDEESYYEVEVTLDDGSQVDVQLDEQFNVVGSEDESGPEGD
ncbi:MAG: hypothetical protein JJLCMIEE_03011 [Acidimicrobiales bacterium]|nr:MAG: hypothetical protein EDR02_16975 [Actinomycetota bacterium]MBV6509896.1 hypothetical protein [Acidimicrobiales bacterium]RIK03286.1 MAG: hypothetical protein DCC48_16820 [Acidobacteriota bacterium]